MIGIVGGSCAGKTWLAEGLRNGLGDNAVRLSLDDFYLDRGHLSAARRARLNFDDPRAIDWKRLEEVICSLLAGDSARVPRYNFATHCRSSDEGTLAPEPVIIVEGLWLYRRASLRRQFDLKIYIRGSSDLCEGRRLRRDAIERGRTPEQIREQWKRQTQPMFEKFVAPQERWADVVLDAPIGEKTVLNLAQRINGVKTITHQLVGI